VWWPLITGHPQAQYRAATAMSTSPYLGRYLLVVAVLFGGSALLYATRLVRASRNPAPPPVDAAVRRPSPTAGSQR